MIEKKDKEAGYIELEQPEGVPDVKSIMEKELDQKLREARVEPQQVDPIRGNTIPPYYSKEVSRYEPPIPVQEKEKPEASEKVKEITNGGSKGSKSEKPVEGDTDLSWDHEGLEPHLKPGEPKPPSLLLRYVQSVRGTMMKEIVQNSYLRKKNRGPCLLNQ